MRGFPFNTSAGSLCAALVAAPLVASPPIISDPFTPADLVLSMSTAITNSLRVLSPRGSATSIQWFKDGVPLPANRISNNTVPFAKLTPDITGNYFAVLANPNGSVTSRTARVVHVPRLEIRRLTNAPTPGTALALAIAGPHLYLGLGDGPSPVAGLDIHDISAPAAPALLGSYRLPRTGANLRVSDVVVEGPRAYLAAAGQGVRVLDVSDPVAPRELGAFPSAVASTDLHLAGNRLFVATARGMDILDVTDPAAIRVVGQFRGGIATGIDVQGNHAFLATGGPGVEVVDVSQPEAPVRIGRIFTGDPVHSVRVRGRHAFISGGFSPQVYDISRPANPFKLGGGIDPVDSRGMAVLDALIFDGDVPALGRPQRLSVFDTGTLPHVVPIGRISVDGPIEDIAINQGIVFAAASRGGLEIFELEPTAPPFLVRPLGPIRAPAGSNVELQARFSGGPMSYQWLRNGEALPGETNRTLQLRGLSQAHVAQYTVIASNNRGSTPGGTADVSLSPDAQLTLLGMIPSQVTPIRPLLLAPPGFQGYVQASSNLVTWQPVWFGEPGAESPDVRDAVPTVPASRYYRLAPGVE